MKLAIVITTYYRTDGKTKEFLTDTLNYVKSQTHQDYFVYLIGDKYTNEDEFYECASILNRDKIAAINLLYAKERDAYAENNAVLYTAGGCNARNVGIEFALMTGYDYIVNLDHDDRWEPDHLERINDVLTKHQEAAFVCTLSTHIDPHHIIPDTRSNEIIQPILPIPCGIIHSSTCINFRKIPLRYKNSMEVYGKAKPSDALLWREMREYMQTHNMEGYLYNKLTCYHDADGGTK
jgi:glycosyltransferase involved in cell wall biosynthesis